MVGMICPLRGAILRTSFKNLHFQNKIPQNSNIRVFLKGDVFFLKKTKKAPARNARHPRPSLFSPKIPNSRNSDQNNTISRKGTRGKMTPQVSSIQCQSLFFIFFLKLIHCEGNRQTSIICRLFTDYLLIICI